MVEQSRRLSFQMYEKELKNKLTSAYNYVGLTNRIDLLEKISHLSPRALKVIVYVVSKMQMRPVVEQMELLDMMVVTIDWTEIGITNRSYRSQVVAELRDIGFMEPTKGRYRYVIGLHYVNPYSKQQHEEVVSQLQHYRLTKAYQ